MTTVTMSDPARDWKWIRQSDALLMIDSSGNANAPALRQGRFLGKRFVRRRVSKRAVYYDLIALERTMRLKGIPTRDAPRSQDWLTPYEKEDNPCQSNFPKAVRAGVLDPPSSK